jgi:hypothetical protein
MPRGMLFVVGWLSLASSLFAADLKLVDDGVAKCAIYVAPRLVPDPAAKTAALPAWTTLKPDDLQRRLQDSVQDLAAVLQRITGAKVDIVSGPPDAGDARIPILIGELAAQKFGEPQKNYPYQQGLRIVVNDQGIGLAGESDLATSYAIYTLLDQLGCRWFMPGELGEVLPSTKTLAISHQDLRTGPSTIFRSIWYCDHDYARRNRLGGMLLNAGHALEFYITKEFRQQHPEVKAIIKGQPHDHLIKWTHPLIAQSISENILSQLAKDPSINSFSVSPDDGATWDESDDAQHDAGDFDPALQCVAKADRLMVLCNRVAETVSAKYPHVRFGMLAYADYTRPPVREKIHPSIVPQIAPITFSRAHPMNDPGEPNNASLRALVEGWGKMAQATSYYFYCFNLAEVASPNPMITKWGHDIPYIYAKGNCQYWQPETLSNFETCLHALWLGLRMAWDNTQQPDDVIAELHEKFYGHAAKPMAAFWQHIDRIWVETPEYSGCGFGHLRRFTPERMQTARAYLNEAERLWQTDAERKRVQLASEAFGEWERFMQLRYDLAEGRFADLAADAERHRQRTIALGEAYQPNFCFTRMGWTGPTTLSVRYFDAFYKATYDDASRIAKDFAFATPKPLRQWKYRVDQEKSGEAAGWQKADFSDGDWKTTDVMTETWSTIGHHNHLGSMWYRTQVNLPAIPPGKKTQLWIGATDGRVKVFVNGQHVPYVNEKQEAADSFSGYCQPASFNITAAMKPSGENTIALFCTREAVNELGTGGLIAPVAIYVEK